MALVPPTSLGAAAGFTPSRNIGQASFGANTVAVASAGVTHLPWVYLQGDAALVNLATAAQPVPTTPGTYAISVQANYTPTDTAATREALLTLYFDLDYYGGPLIADITAYSAAGNLSGGSGALTVTWYFGAASAFALDITTIDANTAGVVDWTGYVQRIA